MPDDVGQRLRTEPNGAYQVYELVAAGAFGSVYFGRDLGTNRAVAIKKLHPHWARDPRAVERFNEEGHTGRELRHPNVVQLIDQGVDDDGLPFIVMQWVEGWTVAALLQRYLEQRGAFPIDEAVEIAWQTLAGLEAARRIGLVHRDIKPLNLMVTPERLVKVMDFGIASAIGQLLFEWGSDWGAEPGQFKSPQDVAVDAQGNIYVADKENHRIQKLSPAGQPLAQWGTQGTGPGQFEAPMAVALDAQGTIYVADTGNDRLQKLSPAGQPLAQWGSAGREPGQFINPRASRSTSAETCTSRTATTIASRSSLGQANRWRNGAVPKRPPPPPASSAIPTA